MRVSFLGGGDKDPVADPQKKLALGPMRIALWIGVSAVGVGLLVTGFIGIIVKGG